MVVVGRRPIIGGRKPCLRLRPFVSEEVRLRMVFEGVANPWTVRHKELFWGAWQGAMQRM